MKNSRSTKPRPPAHLSPEARTWWSKLTSEYVFDSPDAILTLESVMESYDRMTAARKIVEKDGAIIDDRFGQKKQHPATIVERDARMAMLRALRQLGLDVIPAGPTGRPAGR